MAWYNASWAYRVKVTVENTKVSADVTDFPIYVDLSLLPAGFHSSVNQTDARDIRVTKADGTTEVPREVVSYTSASDTGELHFKASGTLSSSTDTDFYIYYGNAAASDYAVTDTYGRNNVWDSNFKMVLHLKETGNGSADEYKDSTSNGNNGSGVAASSAPEVDTSGKIGNAQKFNKPDKTVYDRIQTPLAPSGYSAITMAAWAKLDVYDNYPMLLSYGSNANNQPELRYFSTVGKAQFVRRADNVGITDTVDLKGAGWTSLAGVSTGTNLALYKNGGLVGSGTHSTAVNSATEPMRVGYRTGGTMLFDGSIDEVRVSSTDRSADWIATEYNNQSNNSTWWYAIGAEETGASVKDIIGMGMIAFAR